MFRCRLKNKYGHSNEQCFQRNFISAYDPFITKLSYRNKILENKILWNAGLTNNTQTVYGYDISKSYVNNRYEIVRDYTINELQLVEWDETESLICP